MFYDDWLYDEDYDEDEFAYDCEDDCCWLCSSYDEDEDE